MQDLSEGTAIMEYRYGGQHEEPIRSILLTADSQLLI